MYRYKYKSTQSMSDSWYNYFHVITYLSVTISDDRFVKKLKTRNPLVAYYGSNFAAIVSHKSVSCFKHLYESLIGTYVSFSIET
jgi:hypothetical protein